VPCTYNVATKGEIEADLSRVLATEANDTVPFLVHSDDAPATYLVGNPSATAMATRKLEAAFGAATGVNPFTGNTDQLTVAIADRDELKILHMTPKDPSRIPSFIPFEDPDYFLSASGKTTVCSPLASCFAQSPAFAWNHGDIQPEITTTWLGMVGPGVQNLGQTGAVWSDHTDIRPTILALAALKDDYTHEGRMLSEIMTGSFLPAPVAHQTAAFGQLATIFKQINAPLGQLGVNSLSFATQGVLSGNSAYASVDGQLKKLGQKRDVLANQIIKMLEGAEFGHKALDPGAVQALVDSANDLLASVP
jgi:hypothetical protein